MWGHPRRSPLHPRRVLRHIDLSRSICYTWEADKNWGKVFKLTMRREHRRKMGRWAMAAILSLLLTACSSLVASPEIPDPPVTPTPTATTAVGSTATVTPAVPEVLAGD